MVTFRYRNITTPFIFNIVAKISISTGRLVKIMMGVWDLNNIVGMIIMTHIERERERENFE